VTSRRKKGRSPKKPSGRAASRPPGTRSALRRIPDDAGRREGRAEIRWLPPTVLLLENLVVFFRHYFLGAAFPWDFLGGYYAAPAFWTSAIASGKFPRWVPYQWLGYPISLNVQTGLFYPPLWLFPLFHVPYTLAAAVALQCGTVFAGALGMYFFLRLLVGSRREALVGAFAFQLFGGFYSNAEHVDIVRAFALSPWLLWALTARRSDRAIPARFLAIPPLFFLFATGAYPGATIAVFLIVALYIALEALRDRARVSGTDADAARAPAWRLRSAAAVILVGVGAAMASVTLGPPLLFRREFARISLGPPSQMSFGLVHLAGTVMTNEWLPGDISMTSTFVGLVLVAALFLARLSALRRVWPVLAVGGFAGLMAGGPASPLYRIVRGVLPLVGASRFPIADYRVFVAIAIVAAGSASLAVLRRRPLSSRALALRLGALAVFSAWALLAAYKGHETALPIAEAAAALALAAAAVTLWMRRRGRPGGGGLGGAGSAWAAPAVLLALCGLDAARFLRETERTWVVPRALEVCRSFCAPISTLHDRGEIVAPNVLDGLDGPRPARLESLDGYRASGYLLGTFNIRDNGNMVLETKRALDATAWTRAYIRAPWSAILLDPAKAKGPAGWWVPPPDSAARARASALGSVAVVHSGLDHAEYDVDLPAETLFVENESWFPGWTATVPEGGRRISAEPANRGLRAWRLPAGRYRLETRFRLPGFRGLAALSVFAAIFWIASAVVWRFALRREDAAGGADVSPQVRVRAPGRIRARTLAAALFVGLWLAACGYRFAREGLVVLRDAPREMPPREMWRQIATIDRLAPNEPLFYVMPSLETWDSRMWKRALYPRRVFYVENAREVGAAEYRRLRDKYRIRYALSVGDEPVDPSFRWKIELPPLPGHTARAWFGELR